MKSVINFKILCVLFFYSTLYIRLFAKFVTLSVFHFLKSNKMESRKTVELLDK